MTREIKFRAWNKDIREMIKVDRMAFVENCDELGKGILDEHNDFHKIEDCEIMQFTGLKDKNGKEIYEGDIVKSLFHGKEGLIIGEVIWADVGFYIGLEEFKDELYPWVFYKICEVIGNKFENPELLKK